MTLIAAVARAAVQSLDNQIKAARKIDAFDQWCLRMLLGIKQHQFVRNDEVRRLTGQPKLTAIVQSRHLTIFGHIACTDDNADAKMILSTLRPEDWMKPQGRPRITWLSSEHHTAGSEIPQSHTA